MIHHDRDRLLISIGVALILHAALFVTLAIVGLDFTPYPEFEPVFVTLPDYEEREPEPVEPEPIGEPEPAEPEPAEPEPVSPPPVAPQPAEPEPAPPAPARTPPSPSPAPRSAAPAPGSAQTSTDAPPGSFSTEDLEWLGESRADDRERARSQDDLFAIREPDGAVSDLPSWVVEGEFSIQPESTLAPDDRSALEAKREADARFAARLADLVRALEDPSPGTGPSATGPATASGPDAATTALPGGGAIDWVGSGGRQPVGKLALPELTADDFEGQVPGRIAYLIVFEVNAEGLVMPGLILRQSSGYTRADQKVRATVSSWRFDPAPGAPPVTAIATLHITRDEIR